MFHSESQWESVTTSPGSPVEQIPQFRSGSSKHCCPYPPKIFNVLLKSFKAKCCGMSWLREMQSLRWLSQCNDWHWKDFALDFVLKRWYMLREKTCLGQCAYCELCSQVYVCLQQVIQFLKIFQCIFIPHRGCNDLTTMMKGWFLCWVAAESILYCYGDLGT